MPSWLKTADLALRAGRDLLGEPCIYHRRLAVPEDVAIVAVVDEDYTELSIEGGLMVGGPKPVASIRLADLVNAAGNTFEPQVGDHITASDRGWKRRVDLQQDSGNGDTLLILGPKL